MLPQDSTKTPNTESLGAPHIYAGQWEPVTFRRAPEAAAATVLIVEDEECIAQLLGEFLESAGYQVLVAFNGRAALTLARTVLPTLVLTDLVMPEMDGPSLIQALRASPKTRKIPVVMMSSTRPMPATLHAIPFIAKPFDLDDVLAAVDRYAKPRSTSPSR